jgi:hypothetical protein
LRFERVDHWERIASRRRPAFSSHLRNGILGTWKSNPSTLRPHSEKLVEPVVSEGASLESATLNYFGAKGVYSRLW